MSITPSITLTFAQAVADLKAVVAEKGEEFVYPREAGACVYFTDQGQPSCIVGHVLARHGMSYSDIAEYNEMTSANQLFYAKVIIPADEAEESQLRTLLSSAQNQQDGGHTWGESLATALADADFIETGNGS